MTTATANPAMNGSTALSRVSNKGRSAPNRVCLYAPEKWGKTSFAAQCPGALFGITRGEDGLFKLMEGGLVGPTNHFPDVWDNWLTMKQQLRELLLYEHNHRALVLDTIGGAERLCFEHVCRENFDNDFHKFDEWGRGYTVATKEWQELLNLLEMIRVERSMSVLLLCHSKVETFKNPVGADYDRYSPDMNKRTWGLTHKWLDMILFGQFEARAVKASKSATKGKLADPLANTRIINTERTAAFDAGNRHGLPPVLECGDTPATAWTNFITPLKRGQ